MTAVGPPLWPMMTFLAMRTSLYHLPINWTSCAPQHRSALSPFRGPYTLHSVQTGEQPTIGDCNSHKSSGRSCKHFEKCVQKSALILL